MTKPIKRDILFEKIKTCTIEHQSELNVVA